MSKEVKVESPKAKQNFPDLALSIRQNPNTKKWEIVILRYNVELKACFIESTEEVSENKTGAIEKFKIKAYQLGLI